MRVWSRLVNITPSRCLIGSIPRDNPLTIPQCRLLGSALSSRPASISTPFALLFGTTAKNRIKSPLAFGGAC
jgi:hypothetical protein